jgi:peptidyl-prolyl isomerase G (cyclophilin G)
VINAIPPCSRKHTVFGKLVVGNDVLKRIEQVDVDAPDSTPVVPVTIVGCGELTDRKHGN